MAKKKTAPARSRKNGGQTKASSRQAPQRKTGKMSALDAASKLLAESNEPMNAQEMIAVMAEKGYWKSPRGKTPHATLYAGILRDIRRKGKDARFRKVARGKFTVT